MCTTANGTEKNESGSPSYACNQGKPLCLLCFNPASYGQHGSGTATKEVPRADPFW